ncbi:MAG TPA: hypothetical protein VLA55_08660 [Ornithinibacter sp.]|nr:hypothetical protein [Ornithinibacter sp.]
MTSLTARLAAAALAVPIVIATAGTANAGSKWTYKSSGSFANVSWMEVGELPAPVLGNYHVGYLEVRGDKVPDIYGDVTDWTCPEGELPPDFGGGHEGEEPETGCTLEGSRFIYGDPSAVTFTVDRKLNAATLVGNLFVSDHEGEGTASPPVNMTWTGIGGTSKSTSTETYTDPSGAKFTYRTTQTAREGDIEGKIGVMVFDDEDGEFSYGSFGTYRIDERGTTP